MISKKKFCKGRIPTPWPIKGDAYTVTGELIASKEAVARSTYNFTNRRSPKDAFPEVAQDSRMVLYGLTDFIRTHLTQPLTHKQLDKCVRFMKTANIMGGPLQFNENTWRRVIAENGGYLPITIRALPEGSTFFPNEPVIEVQSNGEGFGEMAAIIEAVMVGMVSIASARVTLCRHWLDRIRERIKKYNSGISESRALELSRNMIHDFGMRASSCAEESELLGRAHLLVFNGTDTFNAAYQATRLNNDQAIGKSIFALAHRIVQGHETAEAAYNKLREVGAANGHIGSYVADCYNFHKDVIQYLIPLAKEYNNDIVVVRPDSGDYVANCIFIVEQAIRAGLYQSQGELYVPKNLTYINGDSMNPDKISEIWDVLEERGNIRSENVNPTAWGVFGVGGYLRNTPNRDSLSSAYKLCAKGLNNEPVIKLSETPAKMSVPGPTEIIRKGFPSVRLSSECDRNINSAMRTYYIGHHNLTPEAMFGDICIERFEEIRRRAIEDFDKFADEPADRGFGEHSVLSPKIIEMQKEAFDKYR